MNITIVGAGRVGLHLAKYFSNEQQDVYLVDTDSEKLAILESDFNMRTFAGVPTDFQILREANVENADIFVALTADTSENLVACAMAKSMGAKRTIARVNRYDYTDPANAGVVRRMGVDRIVYPDLLAAKAIVNSLTHPWCRSWYDFDNGSILLIALSVSEDTPIAGHQIKDFGPDRELFHISALRRSGKTIMPRGTDHILPGDILYITSVPNGEDRVMELAGKNHFDVRNVLVMGGSKVAELTARIAPDKFRFTIIEKEIERCRQLTETCPDANIILGDGSEEEVVEESGIADSGAFVALSDGSECNIISCVMASDAGVKRTIAEIEKEQFISKAETFQIGTVINKPILTANAIFQLILDGDADTSKCFAMTHAEVARLKIGEGSFLTSAPVRDLKIPDELTFAGLIRNGKGEIVNGLTHFRTDDEVIVFCLNGSLDKVEKLFRK